MSVFLGTDFFEILPNLREPFKNYLADFFRLGGTTQRVKNQ